MSWCWSRAATLGVLTLAVATAVGCAEERDPINRVQANALSKTFFVGQDLLNPGDDPEFWTQATLIAAPYGVSQGWLFPSTFSQKLSRMKWQITEDLLLGRLTYELIEDADGRGAGGAKDNDGQIIVAYPITSHFDIRRAYNPSTGEEMNVIEENSSDRPWYERDYFRVDWSQNLQTDSYDFDTLSYHGLDGVKYSSLAYYVNDPSDQDAPYFDVNSGYFDITNKAFATPQMIDLSSLGWGISAFPACYLPDEFSGGTYPSANCNPSEITIRQSFRRVEDHDYEPMDWDGFRFSAFGAFTTERLGYSRNYGMSDTKWHRFISRFNVWERSHYYADPANMTGPVECNTPETNAYGADPKLDSQLDGTDDECWGVTVNLAVENGACAAPASIDEALACYAAWNPVFGGSQCDTFKQKCTMPFRFRTGKPLAWFATIPGNLEYFEGSEWATHEWDVALRFAQMSARYSECRATGGDQAGCVTAYPIYFGQMDDHVDANQLAREVDDCRHVLSYPEFGAANSPEREAACAGLADTKAAERAAAGYALDPGITALAKMKEMIVLCHSPVETNDAEACAPADRRLPADVTAAMCATAEENRDASLLPTCRAAINARRGDLRYHNVNNFWEPHTPSAWGIMTNANDPLSGETISAGITVWTHINDLWTQGVMDRLRYIKGELEASDVTEAEYIVDYENAMEAAERGGIGGYVTKDELRRRGAAFGGVKKEQLDQLLDNPNEEIAAPARQLRAELQGVKASVDGSSVMAPIYEARRQHAIGSETEASLMNEQVQESAGVQGLGLTDGVMNFASPLRGSNPSFQRLAKQLRESALVKRGACELTEAPAPVSIPALGNSLEKKFANACLGTEDLATLCAQRADVDQLAAKAGQDPNVVWDTVCVRREPLAGTCLSYGPFDKNDTKGVQFVRAERMRKYLAQRVHQSVIVHEMGHAVAARHNFVSSADSFSFRPQYWQLRTRNGAVTTRCGCPATTSPTDRTCENYVEDGAECVGPRYFDPMTQEESDGLIWMWQQDSTMEYAGEYTQDLIGIGAWDYAGMAMWYGDVAPVFADPSFAVGSDRAPSMISKMDNFGGIVGLAPDWKGEPVHYSVQQNLFEMIKDCAPVDPNAYRPASWNDAKQGAWDPTLDGYIVQVNGQYTKCRQQKVDYVPWDQMHMAAGAELKNVAYSRAGNSIDKTGRIRVPLGFATDSWADLGNASVYRHDNGADVYEIFNWLATQQEIHHIFDNYRRNRLSFSVRAASNRTLERYNTKIRDGAKGLGLMANVYRDFGAASGYVFDGGYWAFISNLFFPDNILASSMVFDQFVQNLVRPESGSNFYDSKTKVVRSEEDTYENVTASTPRVIIPTGATGRFGNVTAGGKLIENKLCENCGEYDSSYTMNCGSYYDKMNTAYLMTESVDNFISDSREDFVDARYRAVSLADLFPEGFRRMLGNELTNDDYMKSPRLAAASEGGVPLVDSEKLPQYPIGWPSYWPEQAEFCWPANGTTVCNSYGSPDPQGTYSPFVPEFTVPLEAQVGWEEQKFLINWTMLYLPENQKQKWINQLWIWELGQDSEPETLNRIEFHDPSGKIFVAKTFGQEMLFGKSVQKGISARVLEYANELLHAAYVTTDGPDLNGDGTPDWYEPVLGADGTPDVLWSSAMDFITADGALVNTMEGCGTLDVNGVIENYACPCSANYACIQLEKYVTVPFYIRQTMIDYGIVDPSAIGEFDI